MKNDVVRPWHALLVLLALLLAACGAAAEPEAAPVVESSGAPEITVYHAPT